MTGFSAFWSKLRDKQYRNAFVAAQVKQAIPFQVRALLKAQGISQAELAKRAGLTQGAISRAADPEYGNLSLNTLVRVAAGFDVAFVGRFVPYSELWRWLDHLHDETVSVATFEQEDAALTQEHSLPAAGGSALREAAITPQRDRATPWFRLTAPRTDRDRGVLVRFPPKPQAQGARAALEQSAVSQ